MADDELIGRKVDVFWPEEEAWFGGTVVEKGKKPTADTEDGELGVGWKVEYDDGDEGWEPDMSSMEVVGDAADGAAADDESKDDEKSAASQAVTGEAVVGKRVRVTMGGESVVLEHDADETAETRERRRRRGGRGSASLAAAAGAARVVSPCDEKLGACTPGSGCVLLLTGG